MVRAKGGRPRLGFPYPFPGSDCGRKAKADTENPSAPEKSSIVSMQIFEGDGPLQGRSSEQSPEDTRLSPGAPASSRVWLDAIAKYTEHKTEFCAMGVFLSIGEALFCPVFVVTCTSAFRIFRFSLFALTGTCHVPVSIRQGKITSDNPPVLPGCRGTSVWLLHAHSRF